MLWMLAAEDVAKSDMIPFKSLLPNQGDLLEWSQSMSPGTATLLLIVGVVYLMFGYRIFKALVLLDAGILGAYFGSWVADNFMASHDGAPAMCAILGAFTAAAIAYPTMKFAVALMGGIFGTLLGASIWHTVNLDPSFAWAGGLIGLVGFSLLSFVLFRGSIMMYTSLQGAFMLVFGLLGLIYKYQQVGSQVGAQLQHQVMILPMSIFIPTVVGWVFQNHNTGAKAGGGKK